MADTTDNWERLLRCSQCGAHAWHCEQVDSAEVLRTMRMHISCTNCHAHFSLVLGEHGPELLGRIDDKSLAQRLMPHLTRMLPAAIRNATGRRSF